MIKRISLFCVLGLVILGTLLAINQGKAMALAENGCLACHGNPSLFKTDANGNKISLYVNVQELDASSHGYIDCTTCHGDNPHVQDLALNKETSVRCTTVSNAKTAEREVLD